KLRRLIALGVLALAVGVAGCGGDDSESTATGDDPNTIGQQPEAAADPSGADFPAAEGQTMQELADQARPGLEFAPATATYAPGANRVAFGLLSNDNEFIYAPTAVYVGRTPNSPAKGPFLAPADSLVTEAAYRSKNAVLEDDPVASVYSTEVPLPKPGPWSALILSDTGSGLLGATAQFEVHEDDPIPAVGDRPPEIDTDTVDEVANIEQIDTRVPPDSMHETEFADVIGERPVALLFATPQLCQSRVCGPVTDIAEQLKTTYGDEVEFIHQEVYVDNDPAKGLREPLEAFALRSEPWLFTFDADGRIASRLEGSFGVDRFEGAVEEALE
ncbi:MAG: hypothetical protein ACRDKX_04685, partial [Solirubrobacterales bacterium]